jgi:hypothetical protein
MSLLGAFRRELLIDVSADGPALRVFCASCLERGDSQGIRTLEGFADIDARVAATAIRARYALPKPLEVTTEADLLRDPHAFDGDVTATFTSGFEESSFAGAWLEGGPHLAGSSPTRAARAIIRARGIWRSSTESGYGHLGASESSFVAYWSTLVGPA